MCQKLAAVNRWCVTGTPIKNSVMSWFFNVFYEDKLFFPAQILLSLDSDFILTLPSKFYCS